MRKALITLLSFPALLCAGDYDVVDPKAPIVAPEPPPCYNPGEFQVDLFGSGTFIDTGVHDFYGGGIGLNYFFTNNLGLGVNWNLIDVDAGYYGDDTTLHDTSADLILRAPFNDASCTALYGLAGTGVLSDGENFNTFNIGAGIEHRFAPGLGLFLEGRYKWIPEIDVDFAQARVGLRIVF